MPSSEKVYKVEWPKADDHRTKSLSGVLVGTNVQGQVALHFYNEVRALDEEVPEISWRQKVARHRGSPEASGSPARPGCNAD